MTLITETVRQPRELSKTEILPTAFITQKSTDAHRNVMMTKVITKYLPKCRPVQTPVITQSFANTCDNVGDAPVSLPTTTSQQISPKPSYILAV